MNRPRLNNEGMITDQNTVGQDGMPLELDTPVDTELGTPVDPASLAASIAVIE